MSKNRYEYKNLASRDCDGCNKYCTNTMRSVQSVYIIALLLWILLIIVLGVVKNNYIVLFILLITPVVYIINFVSIPKFTCELEDQMFKGNLLSFAFLVAIVLINWNSPAGAQDKTGFFKILITSFILLMLSLLDLWVDAEHMSIVKHVKTCLQTASLTLLALALYLYYTHHMAQISNANNVSTGNGNIFKK
jgi:hypothetical protein